MFVCFLSLTCSLNLLLPISAFREQNQGLNILSVPFPHIHFFWNELYTVCKILFHFIIQRYFPVPFSGWINFVRLMIIVGLFCFTATIIAICLLIYKPRREFRMTVLLFTGIAGMYTKHITLSFILLATLIYILCR